MKKEIKISFICKKCGAKPEIDKKMSNENWNVIPAKCKCGARLDIVVK